MNMRDEKGELTCVGGDAPAVEAEEVNLRLLISTDRVREEWGLSRR